MIRRTSGSSIVANRRGCGANGAAPLTIASAMALSVRTCRPGRSRVRDAHLLLGPLVERHEADRGRRELPVRQQVASALGEHPGLARPGRRDDPGRPTGVGDGGELIGREIGRGGVRAERGQRPVLEREPVHDDPTVERSV